MMFMLMCIYVDISIFAFKYWQRKLSPKAFINIATCECGSSSLYALKPS